MKVTARDYGDGVFAGVLTQNWFIPLEDFAFAKKRRINKFFRYKPNPSPFFISFHRHRHRLQGCRVCTWPNEGPAYLLR